MYNDFSPCQDDINCHQKLSRWWQLKYFWNFHPENWGRWTHFDEHIFQRGWFNHQLVRVTKTQTAVLFSCFGIYFWISRKYTGIVDSWQICMYICIYRIIYDYIIYIIWYLFYICEIHISPSRNTEPKKTRGEKKQQSPPSAGDGWWFSVHLSDRSLANWTKNNTARLYRMKVSSAQKTSKTQLIHKKKSIYI